MLEEINLKKSLSKSAYRKALPELQERLRKLQYAAKAANVATIVCLEGWDAAGKGRVVRKLTQKLDPRLFRVHAGTPPSPLEKRYHFLHRYQIVLPNYGEMVVFEHGWYCEILRDRCENAIKGSQWVIQCQQINEFERWLADDRQLIVKFWMHISKKEQRQRFKEYLADPNMAWRVTKNYKRQHRNYQKWLPNTEDMLAKTGTNHAPWTVVEANDQRWAVVRIFETLAQRIEQELDQLSQQQPASQAAEKIAEGQKIATKKRSKRSHINGRHREHAEVTHA